MTEREALKLALAVLKSKDTYGSSIREAKEKAITAIKEAMTQPEQEPAWHSNLDAIPSTVAALTASTKLQAEIEALLLARPQPAQPLTDERLAMEIAIAVLDHCYGYPAVSNDMIQKTAKVISQVLAKQKEMNERHVPQIPLGEFRTHSQS